MASLSSDGPNGKYRITFDLAGRRKTITLGKVTKRQGEAIRLRVEHLLTSHLSRLPLDQDTASWLAGIGDDLHARLAAVGLVPDRTSQALGLFLDGYLDRRR